MKINFILYFTIIGICFICVKATPIDLPLCGDLVSQLGDLEAALNIQITAILDLFTQLELSNCTDEQSGLLVQVLVNIVLRLNVLFTGIGDIYANLHIDVSIQQTLLGTVLALIHNFILHIGGTLEVITDTVDPIIQLIIPGLTSSDFASDGILGSLLNLVTSLVGTVLDTGTNLLGGLLGTAGPILNSVTGVLGGLTDSLNLGII